MLTTPSDSQEEQSHSLFKEWDLASNPINKNLSILQECIHLGGSPRCGDPAHLLPMVSCLSFLYMCDLGLCPFSGLVCDLLLRGGRGLSLNEHWQEGISFHNCDVHCLEDTGVVWCLSHLGARWRRGFSPELPRARKSRPNSGRVSIFSIFPTCGPRFRDLRRVARERERVTPHIRIRIIRNMKSLEGAFERSGAQ